MKLSMLLCRGLAALFLPLFLTPQSATAEPWLCPNPECAPLRIERAVDATELSCSKCGGRWSNLELAPAVMYINSRTRNAEIAWISNPEDCEIFRPDGLEVWDEHKQDLWVPWILVDYFIPRFEKVRLLDGREFDTDYPKGPTCLKPPIFTFEVTDSVSIPGFPTSVRKTRIDEDIAALFIVATSPEARDSAAVRFVSEVKAGKHPRLPRTAARHLNSPPVTPPLDAVKNDWKGEVVLETRVHERGGILRIHIVKSSGRPALDQAAVQVARMSQYQIGGEMGVGVPSSVRLHFYFEGATARVVAEAADPGMWDG